MASDKMANSASSRAKTKTVAKQPYTLGRLFAHRWGEDLFKHKFDYSNASDPNASDSNASDRALPVAKSLFREQYQYRELQELKKILNKVKSKVMDFDAMDWRWHTRRKNSALKIPFHIEKFIGGEFVTMDWCKLYECLKQFPVIHTPQMNSLHLCEAPGSFVTALNHYLYNEFEMEEVIWDWLATSLNPYYEGHKIPEISKIADDSFMLHTIDQWVFYEDFTGNILDRSNIEQLERICSKRFREGVHLVTADGSVDYMEAPGYQEESLAQLYLAEIVAALCVLKEGGSFVLKQFTLFATTTVNHMYFLTCVFHHVHVFKPVTSKKCNSEVYVICIGYKKKAKNLNELLHLMKAKVTMADMMPMFAKTHIPDSFVSKHAACARKFTNLQIQALESNIQTFLDKSNYDIRRDINLCRSVCSHFVNFYHLAPIPKEMKVMYKSPEIFFSRTFCKNVVNTGSYRNQEEERSGKTDQQINALKAKLIVLKEWFSCTYGVLLKQYPQVDSAFCMPEYNVYHGEPCVTLRHSCFASTNIMQFRERMMEVFSIDPLWHETPKCILDGNIEIELHHTSSANFAQMQQKFFKQIVKDILKHKPREVTFGNFAFLTHYSVSILRSLIDNIFGNFTMSTAPTFAITLHVGDWKYSPQVINKLTKLRNIIQKDFRVLCVLDLQELHHNTFVKALMEYNNMLLLKCFESLITA